MLCKLRSQYFVSLRTELPGQPEIIDAPTAVVDIDTKIKVTCRCRSSADGAQLVWYRDGRPADVTFSASDGYVINEYELKLSAAGGQALLTCRLDYPPADLHLNTSLTIQAQGVCLFACPFLSVCLSLSGVFWS